MQGPLVVVVVLAVLVVFVIAKTAVVVPQQSAYVVERLGRYHATLGAGFHILIPFVDVIRYRHSLKETAVDIPEQVCITRDNVQVHVDGVLYLKVLDPERASYGVADYPVRDHPAGADDAAQRGRQDRPRPHLRGAHAHQHPGGERARQGVRAVGRQGAALRDQEHHAAGRRPRRDGEADARRAREARGHPDLGGRARRRDQQRRGPEAAGDQGLGGQEAAADQRGRGHRRGDPRRSPAPPPRASARSRRRSQVPGGFEAVQLRVAEQYIARFGELAQGHATRSSCRPTSPTSAR